MQKFVNASEVPLPLAVFLASDNYDYNNDENTISATSLLKPTRQYILNRRLTYDDAMPSLPEKMQSRIGQAVHDAIEQSWTQNHAKAMDALGIPQKVIDRVKINPKPEELTPDTIPYYLEQRLSKPLGKWTITGKFDFVGDGKVQDFKTTSVWTYMNQTNNDKYTLQGSIYRWLDPKMITENELDIHYIFTDWKAGMQKTMASYPPNRFKTQTYPLLSIPETEQYIKSKLHEIETYMDAPEEDLPRCSDEDLWRDEPVYKYYKNPDKLLRSTKNYDTRHEAMLRFIEDGAVGVVKEVPGQVTACKYCPSFVLCSQKNEYLRTGELVLN